MTEEIVDTVSPEFIQEFYGERELRWFQIAARNGVALALQELHKRILIVLPTGAGKTLTIAASLSFPDIRKALGVDGNRQLRVLFVAHKHRLLTQAEATFVGESNVDLMLQSMMSDVSQEYLDKGWDVCVLDEAHHEGCGTFQYHLEKLGAQPIIGLTATPDRPDGCLIKFDTIIAPITREQAVAEGYLAPTKIHSFVDVSGKDKTAVLTDMLTSYAHEMKQTLVFVKTKKEVDAITGVLSGLGYATVGLLNQTDREMDVILNDFSAGKIQFIVNCNRISEGVDVQGCTGVLLGRQVGSYPMLSQIIGRAARIDIPECNVWELVNPLSSYNMDTTCVVGTPESHRLVSKEGGKWIERMFNYITHRTNKQLGIAPGKKTNRIQFT
jgi:superfamily II DNA or RNA helicase